MRIKRLLQNTLLVLISVLLMLALANMGLRFIATSPGVLSSRLLDFLMQQLQTVTWTRFLYLKGLTAHGFDEILHK